MVVYYPTFFPKNGNQQQASLRHKRAGQLLDAIIKEEEDLEKAVFDVEKEILETDKPNIWNVWDENNMERQLEVDFQKFGISVTELSGQRIDDITTMTFYATVEYLKEKFKK